jgi:ATP:ADP antiporter, AAA family
MSDPSAHEPVATGLKGTAWLSSIVDARRGEILPMLACMAWIFLALTAYYVIKPLRSAVLQEQIGVDNKWIALIATTVFVGAFAYGYGNIVPRVARSRLIVSTFVIIILCLVTFALTLPDAGALMGYLFFVWVSTFNLMLVSQFWSLANDVWTKQQGMRLFGFIGVGGVAGGIFGTIVVASLAKSLGTRQMLLLSAAILVLCLLLALYILKFGAAHSLPERELVAGPPTGHINKSNSVALVLGSPYLRLIAAMMLILNLVNTNNEWILDKVVSKSHLHHAAIKEFYAHFYLVQNVLTFLIQFFLTARIQRRFGARVALLFEPTVGIVGGLAFLAMPLLAVVRWHKILENAADYSIQSNTKELLYLPVSRVEKYSAKNFNDTFVVRGGDALAAAMIFGATSYLLPWLGDVGLKVLIGVDVGLGVVWLIIAVAIGRMHRSRMAGLTNSET